MCHLESIAAKNLTITFLGNFIRNNRRIRLGRHRTGHRACAYFYGNIATQTAGGILAEKIGGKWVFGGGTLLGAIASLLSPVAAR